MWTPVIGVFGLLLRLLGLDPRLCDPLAICLLHLPESGVDDVFYRLRVIRLDSYRRKAFASEFIHVFLICGKIRLLGLDGVIIVRVKELFCIFTAGLPTLSRNGLARYSTLGFSWRNIRP